MTVSRKTVILILFAAAVGARLLFHFFTGFTADDSLITFRYAENLISGDGFVYNYGEKVLGTTTPLFTFLLSIFLTFKMSPFKAALLISLICSGLTAIIIYRLAQQLRLAALSFVPALVFILWPRSIVADTSGLETSFFTLLIISSWYCQRRRLWFYSVGLATLAGVTRPEGFFLLAIVLIYNCIQDRQNLWAYFVGPAIIVIPWLVFSYFYFGTIVPSTITGKLALYANLETDSPLEKLIYLLGLHHPLGWIMLAAAGIGGWWLYQKQNFGKLEASWLAAMTVFYTFSRTELFFWYFVPIYPIYIIFTSAALASVWDKLTGWVENTFGTESSVSRPMQLALALAISVSLIYMCFSQAVYYKNYARYLNDVHRAIGLYLRDQAKPGDTVSAKYIGYTGYYSKLKVQDRDGMINPQATRYNRRGDYLGLVLDYQPEWVVAAPYRETETFANNPYFLSQYEAVKSFGWEESVRHNLYKRKS